MLASRRSHRLPKAEMSFVKVITLSFARRATPEKVAQTSFCRVRKCIRRRTRSNGSMIRRVDGTHTEHGDGA